jgi:hypothetical protein
VGTSVFAQELLGLIMKDQHEGAQPRKVYWVGTKSKIEVLAKSEFFADLFESGKIELVRDNLKAFKPGKIVEFERSSITVDMV